MRIGEVLGLSWNDIDFVAKKITLKRQLIYLKRRGYFLTTLKTESSKCYVIVDDYLLGELRRWKNQQLENEKIFGDNYIYVYREDNGHILRQSKGLLVSNSEKVSLMCTRDDGRIILRGMVINF